MTNSIDERVVRMTFENSQFQQGAAATLATLEKLNKGLKMDGAAKGLQGIGAAATAQQGSIKNLEAGIGTIADKFKAMGVVGVTALATITHAAISAGAQVVKSFTFSPVTDGFKEYETNLNSIQTILANTQAAGTTLKDVNHTLEELNHYSDQTIYNFAEMAKNIGTFTAAGVDLKTSTAAIKGIANLAALSGSNSEQASGAMYQLSQAISAGRVSLEDWNSVVNAGMGGTVFQRALAMNAEKMGTLSDGAVKLSGKMKNVTIEGKSFRESITAKPGEESWLTSEVLTRTLSQFTGDLTDAQLKAQGFNKTQIKAIQDQAKMAKSAATEVKTLTQLFGTFKEQLGSGWAQTWQTIFGDFTEAKGLFTGVSNAIGSLLQKTSDSRNKMLSEWKTLGGRTALIEGISNAFKALMSFMKPIAEAFRQIFPATTGKQLYDMTVRFREFTEKLKIGADTAEKLKRTFAGVFAVFGIVVDVIKAIASTIGDLVGQATKGSGGFLDFTAKVGDFLVKVRTAIREGEGLTNLFKGIGTVLAIPIKLVQKFAGFLAAMFKDTDTSGVTDGIGDISAKLEPLGRLGQVVSLAWDKVVDVMRNVYSFVSDLGDKISNAFKSIGVNLGSVFEGFDVKTLFAGIDTGLLAGLFLLIKKFIGGLGGGGNGGVLDSLKEGLDGLTGALTGMQNALKAATLLQIAIAIGILAVSMNTLSKIDPEDLAKASGAITVMFAQLLGSLTIFQKFIGAAGFAKLPFVMGSLILLATAVNILASAVKKLADLDWNGLAKGLTGVTVLLAAVVGALKFMPNPAGMISTGLGLIALAAGIKILASAVEDLSDLGWNALAKGLVGVGTLLGTLVLFTMFAKANKGGIAQGAGIILLAAGIKILASAVKDMSEMSWNEIAKGLVTLAGALAIISGALKLIPSTAPQSALGVLAVAISLNLIGIALDKMAKMSWANIASSLTAMLGALAIISAALYVIPPTGISAAAGILIVSASLLLIAKALQEMATMGWEDIGKAMTVLVGSLVAIAGALYFMTAALPGAAALLVVSGALAVLAPILMLFGNMSWTEIAKGLIVLAGALAVIGVAGYLLAPVAPVILALGGAIALLGIGISAAGAGVLLFAVALTALAGAGAAAVGVIVGIVAGLIGLIPKVMEQIGLGIIAFAKVIATAGPAILKAITVVLTALIGAIVNVTPKIVDALLRMLLMLLQKLQQYVPKMVDAGMKLITGILNGIAKNISKMITAATNVIVNFLNGITKNLPRIIDSGVKLIISFVNGVAKAIDSHAAELGAAGGRLAVAIITGMVKGIGAGIGQIASAAKNAAKAALNAAKDFLGINSPSKEFIKVGKYVMDGFRKGLDGNKAQIDTAFNSMKKQLLDLSKSAKATAKERAAAAKAYSELTKKFADEHATLGKLATQYDAVTNRLKAAQDTLANAIKTRDDYNKQIRDQYSDMPSATGETKLADYLDDLKKQIEDTKVFSNTLQRLRNLGLNDESYQDLLATGTSALPFVQELLAGGKGAVDEVNNLGKQLDTVGAALGKSASSALYQAGVDAAAGLAKGLQFQQGKLEKQMDKLADAMVKAIKTKLGIKSPSRIFMEVGDYAIQGLVKGMENMTVTAEKAAAGVGYSAVDSLSSSLSGMTKIVSNNIDVNPTITPVLDLSSIKKNAGQLGSLLTGQRISVDSSYSKANVVASQVMRSLGQTSSADIPVSTSTVSYTQNNYSPKALSQADIYRQTKNQLSKVKGALEP